MTKVNLSNLHLFPALLITFFMSTAYAFDHENKTNLRKNFLAAEKLISKNKWEEYQALKSELVLYPLYPYLIYKELKHKIKTNYEPTVSLQEINQFNQTNPDFPFKDALTKKWTAHQFELKNWNNIVEFYADQQNLQSTRDQCYYLYSRYQLHPETSILDKALELWMVGHSQPNSCDSLFQLLKNKGRLTSVETIERLTLVVQAQNFKLANYLTKQLPRNSRKWANNWMLFLHAPENILSQRKITRARFPSYLKEEIITTTLQRLIRKNAAQALTWWESHHQDYRFSDDQIKRIKRDIAVFLSHQRQSIAYQYISEIPNEKLDDVAKEWRIRLSLFEGKWSDTLKWIQALPFEQKSKHVWRYWRARAMENLGSKEYADAIYQQLASQRGYYGFLSSLRLNKSISLNNHEIKISSKLLLRLDKLPSYIRVKELLALNRPRIARVEWYQLAKNLPDIQRVHLAHMALQNGWHDLSILTLTRSELKDNLALRFPIAHQKHILHYAKKYNLDPAWIFALTRQESAFFHYALSPVGARGLMQLMPTTARYVAQKNNIKLPSSYHLYLPEKNIELGTTYLNYLNEKSNYHPVIATASYNAGPGRTKTWIPKHPVDADIWIENIPYRETRNYVKNIMASTSIYQKMLGEPIQLGRYMRKISAN